MHLAAYKKGFPENEHNLLKGQRNSYKLALLLELIINFFYKFQITQVKHKVVCRALLNWHLYKYMALYNKVTK